MRRLIGIGVLVLVLMWIDPTQAGIFSSEPWSYQAEPIEGRVLDKETGQPIEGAVIVAQWILAKPLEGHETDHWVVIEAVTDVEGRYQVSGWGPKRRPWFRWLTDYDPQLVIFKPGYWLKSLGNKDPAWSCIICNFNERGSKLRKAYWNRKDILLVPFRIGESIVKKRLYEPAYVSPEDENTPIEMTEEKWAEQISFVQQSVAWGSWYGRREDWMSDDWLRIMNLIKVIYKECLKLKPELRNRIDRMPEHYRKLILGDVPPCL